VAELLTLPVAINMVRLRHGHQRLRPAQTEAAATLVVALARAYTWQQLLLTGAYRSVQHLASSLGCDASYVAHTLNLALLAPAIIEAIMQGCMPALTLKTMPKTLPVDWEEQRVILGVCSPSD
jgi:hypothetical protein